MPAHVNHWTYLNQLLSCITRLLGHSRQSTVWFADTMLKPRCVISNCRILRCAVEWSVGKGPRNLRPQEEVAVVVLGFTTDNLVTDYLGTIPPRGNLEPPIPTSTQVRFCQIRALGPVAHLSLHVDRIWSASRVGLSGWLIMTAGVLEVRRSMYEAPKATHKTNPSCRSHRSARRIRESLTLRPVCEVGKRLSPSAPNLPPLILNRWDPCQVQKVTVVNLKQATPHDVGVIARKSMPRPET